MAVFEDIPEYFEDRKNQLKNYIKKCSLLYSSYHSPRLTVIQIGNDPSSDSYIRGKRKDCKEVGIKFKLMQYDEDARYKTLEYDIQNEINNEEDYSSKKGIIIQRPVPERLKNSYILDMIPDSMDVDGFNKTSRFNSCTAKGIIDYLDYCNFKLDGAIALVIGRSDIVGKPLANMLIEKNATVIQAHSHTWPGDLEQCISQADIVFTAIDKIQYFYWNNRDILSNTWFVDIGLGKGRDGKLHGNLSDDTIARIEEAGGTVISGTDGVELLTRLALMENVVDATFYGYPKKKEWDDLQ